MMNESNRKQSGAIDVAAGRNRNSNAIEGNRLLSTAIENDLECNRQQSTAIDYSRPAAFGSIRLLSIAIGLLCAGAARADLDLSALQFSTSAASAGRRIELRAEGTVGHALVGGTEWKAAPDGASGAAWDTASLATGWQTLTSGTNAAAVLKLDPQSTAIEGGRLQSNTTWTSAKTHVVRNWVIVPGGVTLTISQGAIVKFCESAGIKVLSGGKVQINGAEGACVFFASIGNDTYGGDTNLRDGDFATNAYEIVTLNGGTWSDNGYWVTPDAQLRGYPEVTLHDSLASVSDGVARVPVTVEGTRNAPFSIDWALGGSPSPATVTSGTLVWSNSGEGTKYIEIPLRADYEPSGVETFTLRATLARSVTRANETCAVRIFKGDIDLSALQYSTSAASAGRRLELREEGTVGHALVNGTEYKGDPAGGAATVWDTASLSTGWQTLTSGGNSAAVLKLDPHSTAIEGGRLQSNTTWTSAKTHVVRNWVIVPSGVTLTISQGAIVKFCESAGIRVLSGGKVQINGAEGADVFFASIGNDTYGGDTNLRDGDFATNAYEIVTLNGGLWSDNGYWVTPDAAVRPYPEVALHDAIGAVEGGVVRVPVTVEGTRNAPFSIDWALGGSPSPATVTSGTLAWSNSGEGTKYIEIPLRADAALSGVAVVALSATRARSVNLANDAATVRLYDGRISVSDVIENGESGPSAGTPIETRGIGGTLIAKAVEKIAYSPRWSGAAECSITLDGNRLLSTADTGALTWSRPSAPGLYTFTHTAGRDTLTARLAVLGEDAVAIDGTRLQSDATWTADKVWVVRGTVTVASGATLTIQPGAVVKFAPGATLAVESGATCVARGSVFTHLYDDTAGGDTLGDGDATAPKMDDYAVTGTVQDDDATEWRYTAPVVLSGTINADTRWRGWKVYRVTGNLTVASGKTLAIEPGAVVKFNSGVSLTVQSGATLNAIGTRAQPIVFTSIKDDEFGGDTTKDGDKTRPDNGDWDELRNSGGTLRLVHAKVFYGGYGQYSNQGDAAVRTSGGTTTLECCEIAHTDLRLLGRTGGAVSASNCALWDGRWGWDGAIDFLNGVVADCLVGANGGTATNTVFLNCSTVSSGTKAGYCLAFGETYPTQSGFLWGDPCFRDADAGDFRTKRGSACIDAGLASAAPELDFYGQPRDGAPDIGLYEAVGDGAVGLCNLAPASVTPAATALQAGETLRVAWRTANVGATPISGSWRDRVSLVDATGVRSVDLGTVVSSGALAPGASGTYGGSFRVPAEAEGTWFVAVHANAERDLFEGVLGTNNVLVSATAVTVAIPAAAPAAGVSGAASADAPGFAKVAADGEALIVRVSAPAGTVVYLGADYLPSAGGYTARAVAGADGTALLAVPAGTDAAYLVVESAGGAPVAWSASFESGSLAVSHVSVPTLPYAGTATLGVTGAAFADGCVAALVRGGAVAAGAVAKTAVLSTTTLSLTLDCSKLTQGATYDLRVTAADGTTASLQNAVTVATVPPKAQLKASLDVPATVRRGRTVTVWIDYENVGNAEMPAPVFEIVSQGQVFQVGDAISTNAVKVMGLSAEAPVGALRPGEPQRLGVKVTLLSENIQWTLKSHHALQEGAGKPFRLETVVNERWVWENGTNAIFRVLVAKTGKTASDFYANLAAYASETRDETTGVVRYDDLAEEFVLSSFAEARESLTAANVTATSAALPSGKRAVAGLRGAVAPTSRCGHVDGLWDTADPLKDNADSGSIWEFSPSCCTGNGWWHSTEGKSYAGQDVVVIIHGHHNSVAGADWIRKMAQQWKKHCDVVLAVDWGDDARHLDPWSTASHIPTHSEAAIENLISLGVSGTRLTLVGHSHGGHFAGRIAEHYSTHGLGRPKRLIGMDSSPVFTHPPQDRFPSAWDWNSARRVEFYKSSKTYSMGSNNRDEVFGIPSFFVVRDHRGSFGTDNVLNATDNHGFSCSWVTERTGETGVFMDADDSDALYQLYSGLSEIADRRFFSGVLRGSIMECGADLYQRTAKHLGKEKSEIHWRFLDDACLGKPDTLAKLRDRMGMLTQYRLDGFGVLGEKGALVNGEKATVSITGLRNDADNLSTDYDGFINRGAEWPGWTKQSKTIGPQVWAFDLSTAPASVVGIAAKVGRAGDRITKADVETLAKSGVHFAPLLVFNSVGFIYPETERAFSEKVSFNLTFGKRQAGRDEEGNAIDDGEDVLFVAVAGSERSLGRPDKDPTAFYRHDLCWDDDCVAKVIKVYDGTVAPTGEVLPGEAVGWHWSTTIYSAFAPENVRDDNTWTANPDGTWTVKLTGATSYGPTNIVSGLWSGADCAVSPRTWSANPNVTVTGTLPRDATGDFEPAHTYTVSLDVKDANGETGSIKYTFTVRRSAEEDPGETEDTDGSREVQSCDPNEMAGPEKENGDRTLLPGEWATYTIYFENKSDAEADAFAVTVTQALSYQLDWSTFEMIEVGYGSDIDMGLAGKSHGTSDGTVTGTNYMVRTTVVCDASGVAKWELRIVDPDGDEDGWPRDPYAGFLPPNNPETHCGEGHITYRVKVRADAVPGARIDAAATIVFDYNDPIPTDPAWWNTVGALATPLPVHRFYSKAYKGHFFTISEAEKQDLIAHNPNWKYEGPAYQAYTNEAPGTVALYRFYSKNYRGHFFTIDADEAEAVKLNRNWKYEGIAYYVYAEEVEGSVPVFRFWSKRYRHHFYTIDEAEKNSLIETNPNWAYEGVAFYALPAEKSRVLSVRKFGTLRAEGAIQTEDAGLLDGANSAGDARKDAETGTRDPRNDRRGAERASAAQTAEALAPAPWTLVALPDAVLAAEPGTTEIGGVIVETRADAPDADELQADGTDVSPAGELALRLSLPGGAFDAALWSAAGGMVAEETGAEGAFDFDLPVDGVWHWLRIRDADEDAFSVWLRAE